MADWTRLISFVFVLALGPSAMASEKTPLTLGVLPM